MRKAILLIGLVLATCTRFQLTVDRIEGNLAVVEVHDTWTDTNTMVDMPKELVNDIAIDSDRQDSIQQMFDSLMED